jgi:hypothetical protein
MNVLIFVAAFATAAALSDRALAWGHQGHEPIGLLADRLLAPNAEQQVANSLAFNHPVAGPWAFVALLTGGTFKYEGSKPEYRIACRPHSPRGRIREAPAPKGYLIAPPRRLPGSRGYLLYPIPLPAPPQ